MLHPVEFTESNTFFKKSLQAVDSYCSWGDKKVLVVNDENDAVVQKRPANFFKTLVKVITYATIIIPLVMHAIRYALHRNFKATVLDINQPNLNDRQKEVIYRFNSNVELWENNFGYSKETILNFPREVQFLKRTGLLFMSKAYESSNYESLKEGIKFDTDHHPMILSQGEYVRVDTLLKDLRFEENTNQILDNDDKEWGFYPPSGLVQSPWKFDRNQETYQLNKTEMAALRETAKKYNPNVTEQSEFIQIYTSEDPKDKPPSGLTKNIGNLEFSHTGVRLIKADGKVYSLAIENKYFETVLTKSKPFNMAAVVPASISRRDYQEIRPFGERFVTTIPIAEGKASIDTVLNELQQIVDRDDIRFNFAHMNCVAFADLVLRRFEVEGLPECEMRVAQLLSTAMPGFEEKDHEKPHKTNKFQIAMENLLTRVMGLDKNVDIDNSKQTEDFPQYWNQMWAVGKKPMGGLLDEERSKFMWSGSLNRWQKRQASTETFVYDPKDPKFFFVK